MEITIKQYITKLEKIIINFFHSLLDYLPSIVLAIVVFIIGSWVIKKVYRKIKKSLNKKEGNVSLNGFLSSASKVLLTIALIVLILRILGIPATSIIAVLSALGLGIGFALQSTLLNIAGGLIILSFKPFEVGHSIQTEIYSGEVIKIDLMLTTLRNADNQVLTIPNSQLISKTLINNTKEFRRRINISLYLPYQSDIIQIRELVLPLLDENKKVLKNPVPLVVLNDFQKYFFEIQIKFWALSNINAEVKWEMLESIKQMFDKNQIEYFISEGLASKNNSL